MTGRIPALESLKEGEAELRSQLEIARMACDETAIAVIEASLERLAEARALLGDKTAMQ